MRIAVIVDNPLRDLPASGLLAAELSKNHDVFLISMSNAGTEIFQIKPDLVLLNYLRETNSPLIHKLINSGIAYSVLDTEGGVFMDVPNSTENTYTITLPRNPTIRNNITHYYLWGVGILAALKKRNIFDEKKLFCLGTPRMDFFAKPWLQIVSTKRQTDRPMILVNTSFAGNNPRFSNKKDEMNMLVKKFGYTPEFIRKIFDNLDKTHFAYIDLTLYLAKSLPQVDFVLRPHPFESEQIYKERFAGQNNIQVILSGTAAEWISQAKALIHFECSTAIESSLLNVPVFSLSKYQHVRPLPDIQSISDYAGSFDEMRQKLELVLKEQYIWPFHLRENMKSLETRLYFKIDGLSYKRIADAINESEAILPKKSVRLKLNAFFYSLFFFLRATIKNLYVGELIPERKRITEADLNSFLLKLAEADPALKATYQQIPMTHIFKIVSLKGT